MVEHRAVQPQVVVGLQEQVACQRVDVHQVWVDRLTELHVHERARHPRVGADVVGDRLDRDVRLLGRIQQMRELRAHDFRTTDLAPNSGLVHDGPHLEWSIADQALLPFHASPHTVLDFFRGDRRSRASDRSPRVVLGLEQAGDVQRLVVADGRGFVLEVDVGRVLLRQLGLVGPQPALAVGVPGQFQQVGPHRVGDGIEVEQGLEGAWLRTGSRGLDAVQRALVDLGLLLDVLTGQACLLAQTAQRSRQAPESHGRGLGLVRRHL
jgi:hypothetical protein